MCAFSSCGELGLLSVGALGLLISLVSLVAEHMFQERGLQKLWLMGLVVPPHVGSSQTRDGTCVSCTGRSILYH